MQGCIHVQKGGYGKACTQRGIPVRAKQKGNKPQISVRGAENPDKEEEKIYCSKLLCVMCIGRWTVSSVIHQIPPNVN